MKAKMFTVAALLTLSFSASANDYFNSFDVDKNGYIDINEHKQMSKGWMDKKGIKDEKLRAKYNQGGFDKKDANKDGKLTLEEFKKAQKKKKKNKNK
ncbi:EF-hand domain-containing protein [Thalassotalea nanhaiensis]|uniref:EF-hand domain-containing protein n=1 Tax=Thalassotalea nanhaiensis TaxID=3065648 RepID=A0ABY9TK92_9GAMM|nr:EF-hand domain-containing protein [Colwelliaceae bacterium SQ345]